MLEYREARKDDAKALLAYKKQVFDESEFLSRPGSEYQVTVEEEAEGIGKKLMQKAIEFFEASPLHRLELTVVKDNVQAVTLYKKLGFREEGIMKDGIKQNQTYYDILVMAMVKEDTK